jgi:magnesium-dependent phosphatase 1
MIVFDLDDCLWSPEMYTLYDTPSIPIEGNLNPDQDQNHERGIVGMAVPPKGQPIVKLFPDARRVLRSLLLDPKYQHVKVAAASSSEEPTFSYSCLRGIEIVGGVKMIDMFHYHEIGRTGHLTSRKTTHFKALQEKSGVPFHEMLFFDGTFHSPRFKHIFYMYHGSKSD